MNTQQIKGLHGRPGLDMATVLKRPLLKYHSIPVSVRRYFTDTDGQIVAKNTVPMSLRTQYPFFLLGDFDRQGGYSCGLKVLTPESDTFYLMSFVEGNGMTSQQITGFTGFNNIRTKIRLGDIVHVYTDNLNAPNFFIWVVQSTINGAIASIIGNSETSQLDGTFGKLYIDHFNYTSDNRDPQWSLPLHFTRSTNIASFRDEQVQPYMFKNAYTEQDGFIRIDCKFNLDQYQSIGTYFLYDSELLQFNFSIGV